MSDLVAQIIAECAGRDQRCARLLAVDDIALLAPLFVHLEHVEADVVGDGAKLDSCPRKGVHPHRHSHFYSIAETRRSKRRLVSVHLFWKRQLGWDFPVSDEMLAQSRPFLDSCELGFLSVPDRCLMAYIVCCQVLHYYVSVTPCFIVECLSFLSRRSSTRYCLVHTSILGWGMSPEEGTWNGKMEMTCRLDLGACLTSYPPPSPRP